MLNNKSRLIGRAGLGAAVAVLAAAPAIATASTSTVIGSGHVTRGTVVVSKTGLTLYGFAKDHGSSTCNGSCAKTWVPWIANGTVTVKSGSGLSQTLVGKTKRSNGQYQITYGGHPLYHYVGDKMAGQQNGQDKDQFGGYWYVVSPQGKLLKPSTTLVGGY